MPPASRKESKVQDLPEGMEDHRARQRYMWLAQRVAWLFFALLLTGCLLGLFGRGGLFSRTEVALEGGMLDLPAISRWNAPDELRVTLAPSPEGEMVLFMDQRFFETFSIEEITPPQKAVTAEGARTGYIFATDAATPVRIVLRLRTQAFGARPYRIGIGEEALSHSTFIFP